MSIALALDIDDTITARPEFFSLITHAVKESGGRVFIVSTRHDVKEVRAETEAMISRLGIEYDELHLIADMDAARAICPHEDLDEYQRWVWQKVDYCLRKRVDVYFDDDEIVAQLFRRFAPDIQFYKACKEMD
jgi:hypothetical protein